MELTRDLSPFWIKVKALLFLVIGAAAVTLLVLDRPTLRTGALLAAALWSFCRLYYFAFYVIEKYVDGKYRYAGLWSFAVWIARGKR